MGFSIKYIKTCVKNIALCNRYTYSHRGRYFILFFLFVIFQRLCHCHHTFFLAKSNTILDDLFHAPSFQSFCIFLFFDLLQCFCTCFLQITVIRIFQFDHNPNSVRCLNRNVAVSLTGFRIGLKQPIALVLQKPEQQPVIEVFLHVPSYCRVSHANGIPQVIAEHFLNRIGITFRERRTKSG